MKLRNATLASKDMFGKRRQGRLVLIEDYNSLVPPAKPGNEWLDPTVELEFYSGHSTDA
jgi:hypothetical protein